ncbi:cytochrome c peroxidase [uncultured Ferrimonas sp.]|uniref:cytochrome-c peroxidase n=1 Tax=uncultured Ferrimonas sp. TaxID=432640 RepID=UPI00262EC50E|nr:cytochrome c peroxidase [uncultured Ferrimonas sp.]
MNRPFVSMLVVVASWLIGGCGPIPPKTQHPDAALLQQAQAQQYLPVRPIPRFNPYDVDLNLARLGRDLFTDPRLSSNNKISCASCHLLQGYGTLASRTSVGVNGQGSRNSPTVFNASLNPMQFWDGRALSLAHQLQGPLQNPLEMDSNWPQVLSKLGQDDALSQRVEQVMGQPLSATSITAAIVYFQQQLLTPDANFDRFLRGESELPRAAKAGWDHFQKIGCIQCHQGINVGGNLMQTFGLTYQEQINRNDLGLAELTSKASDDMVFRVPSLRNVVQTGPYFHDGSVDNLGLAVRIMALNQLGKELSEQELSELLAFLASLSAPPPPILALLDDEQTF